MIQMCRLSSSLPCLNCDLCLKYMHYGRINFERIRLGFAPLPEPWEANYELNKIERSIEAAYEINRKN